MPGQVAGHTIDPVDLGLPPLSASFGTKWAGSYRGVFLPDTYPARLVDGGAVAHPAYGVDVVRDYLSRYEATGERPFLDAALRVARAAASRMREEGDVLVFWYEPAWGLTTRVPCRHYSAVTQSAYAALLTRTGLAAGDTALVEAGRRALAALTVPLEAGGVLVHTEAGPAFEASPTQPPGLGLAGWQSTLLNMWDYSELVDDRDVRETALASARTMLRMLPLYDVPELHTSRYALSAFVHARVLLDVPGGVVEQAELEVPGAGTHEIPVGTAGGTSRWTHFLFGQDLEGATLVGRQLRMNLVMSRVSHPEPNVLRLAVRSSHVQRGRLQLRLGRYSPSATSPVDLEWKDVRNGSLVPGTTTLTLPLSWQDHDLVGYPTTFVPRARGRRTNVYHRAHISRLRQLAERTGIAELDEWAALWAAYTRAWPTSPVYAEVMQDEDHSPTGDES